jgi:TatD DNase family protein
MNDSHAHLTIEPISENVETALERFKNVGGKYLLNVSYNPESCVSVISQHHKFSSKYPQTVLTGLGLHPECFSEFASENFDIYEKTNKTVEMVEQSIEENRDIISAIGETGLDYYHIFKDSSIEASVRDEIIEAQKISFKRHLEIALKMNKPVTIHTRDLSGESMCIEDTLSIVSQIGKGNLKGSFHSYTGEPKYIKDILDLGFHIGINGIVTYPSAQNIRDMVVEIPEDRILVETDCPLLPPQSVRQNRKAEIRYGQPSDIKEILEYISKLRGVSYEQMEKQIDANFLDVFLRD